MIRCQQPLHVTIATCFIWCLELLTSFRKALTLTSRRNRNLADVLALKVQAKIIDFKTPRGTKIIRRISARRRHCKLCWNHRILPATGNRSIKMFTHARFDAAMRKPVYLWCLCCCCCCSVHDFVVNSYNAAFLYNVLKGVTSLLFHDHVCESM